MTAGPGSLRPVVGMRGRTNTSIVTAAACHDRRDEDAAGVCEVYPRAASVGFFLLHFFARGCTHETSRNDTRIVIQIDLNRS